MLSASPSPRLYLASASPRRRELLTQIGLTFMLLPQDIDESPLPGEIPELYVQRVAMAKALSGWRDERRQFDLPVLAADTTVVCDGKSMAKPASLLEARTMLSSLSGRSHQVMTAIAVAQDARHACKVVHSDVSFRPLSPEEIDAYWHSGEPRDKAGGYGIQGKGALFVSKLNGSYSNVVGLPLYETASLLEQFGISSASLLQEREA